MFGFGRRRRPEVVAFDIIQTVFPIDPLRSGVVALGLPPAALGAWYAAAVRDSMALTAAGHFEPFADVLDGALEQTLGEFGLRASAGSRRALIRRFGDLPARPDAEEAFETALDAGMRIMALSNGSAASIRSQLRGAGLLELVHHVVSAEEVKRFKPQPEVYQHAARVARRRPARMALVSVHPWDIQGAGAVGWTTAFVTAERPFPRVMQAPHIAERTLSGAVEALAAL